MRAIPCSAGVLLLLLVPGCSGGGGPSELPQETEIPIVSVEVSPLSTSTGTGRTIRLSATPVTAAGSPVPGMAIEWGSDDGNLTLSPVPGEPYEVEVTSTVATVARVTATVQSPGGPVTGEATVRFRIIIVATVSVIPSTTTLPAGRTMRFTATPRNAAGGHERDAFVNWSTSDPNVTATPYAFNPQQADVRSLVAADAIVTASVGDVSGSGSIRFTVTGTCPVIDHVQIAISDGVVDVGQTTHLQAIPKDAADNTLPTTGCTIEWAATPGLALTVDPGNSALASGTGETPGTVTVTATVGGKAGSVPVTVRAPGTGG